MTLKVIIAKGLPGSGKTTWAKKELLAHPSEYKRINKDDLRDMLDGGKWSKGNEKFVLHVRDKLIGEALSDGFSVIVDDTNLDPKHIRVLEALTTFYDEMFRLNKNSPRVEFEIKDFTDISVKACIKNDLKRNRSVGQDVIMDMYNRYLKPKPEVIEQNPELPDAVQFDLDGTLALFGDANPYDRDCSYDTVYWEVYDELIHYQESGYKIIILSGRKGEYLDKTNEWLQKNGIKPDLFVMRQVGDERPDYVIKGEMFKKYVLPKYNVKVVFDDRDQVVQLWRDMGLKCFQVAEGKF